ncbi:spore cortex biosynthesis protein YabQ [Tissierella praeacuta]|uniref:Spore cortex biosynthesis protein YabQ n=1 Tax=Tissierella praeacuta DSM 18095 TaxID=1123404 RepID=A0A1M4UNV7_9FIRM|nr:spore cortex biosynthesis protein YabQ [Tissierella praeacuta]HAE92493.1 spore cortex biosynthesis protein YabQ [Tissierella sp.]MBU5257280.1 spore cortex biosynthesis protein YabQ [Tissierella praeacuta]TCU68893.1 spore cortex biosynthesis protein YabQ [Tissierella praeacuta]SHE58337.1 spore cortex biosynthesis protein YabQ [Tissierella praeacuta DSM 18095]SUP03496.1 spore cortex biosynthesis protein YabQ [Tissierella praeacuta]
MDTSLMVELYIFLTAAYGGLIAGFIYDIYKTVRYFSKPSKIVTYIEDILFWTIIASVFFFILIKINWGEIRGYIILGFIIGAFIYLKIFSKFIYPICIKVGRIVREIIKRIVYLVFYPIKFFKSKSLPTVRKMKKISIELAKQREKYKKIISTKK